MPRPEQQIGDARERASVYIDRLCSARLSIICHRVEGTSGASKNTFHQKYTPKESYVDKRSCEVMEVRLVDACVPVNHIRTVRIHGGMRHCQSGRGNFTYILERHGICITKWPDYPQIVHKWTK